MSCIDCGVFMIIRHHRLLRCNACSYCHSLIRVKKYREDNREKIRIKSKIQYDRLYKSEKHVHNLLCSKTRDKKIRYQPEEYYSKGTTSLALRRKGHTYRYTDD